MCVGRRSVGVLRGRWGCVVGREFGVRQGALGWVCMRGWSMGCPVEVMYVYHQEYSQGEG